MKGPNLLSTGEVARICQTSPRTVTKWFDSGKLRGYRLPGSQDRRIPREQLIRFLTENKMPLGELAEEVPSLLVASPLDRVVQAIALGLPGWRIEASRDLFGAGLLAAARPGALLLDFALGRGDCLIAARGLRLYWPYTWLGCLANEDDPAPAELLNCFDAAWAKPCDLKLVIAALQTHATLRDDL